MMYLIANALKNLIRYKKRTLAAALLLTAVLSVLVCQLFLGEHYTNEIEDLRQTYENRYRIVFRDDLQFEGNRKSHAGIQTIPFDAESMAAYDHPYPMTTEMFETIADVPYVSDASLAYMVRTYRLSETVPAGLGSFVQSEFGETYDGCVIGCTVVGGSREEFERIVTEENGRGVWSYRLVSGRYPAADGECAMTAYAASLFGKTLGDDIELYGIGGEVRVRLTITGLTALDFADCWRTSPSHPRELTDMTFDLEDLFSLSGTPFDRLWTSHDDIMHLKKQYPNTIKQTETLFGTVFTTYDTAYALDEEHHFNSFAFSCTVEEGHAEDWIEHIRSVLPAEYAHEFTAYNFTHTLEKRTEHPLVIAENTAGILPPVCLTAIGLFFLNVLLSLHERTQETGILFSLGIPAAKIHLTCAAEHALLALFCTNLSSAAAVFAFRLSEANYMYLSAEELTYRLPLLYIPLLIAVPAAVFALSYLLSAVQMHAKTPLGLLRRD